MDATPEVDLVEISTKSETLASPCLPYRFQLQRKAGYQKPMAGRSVARPHIFGNPFPVNADRTAAEAVDLYRRWMAGEEFAGVTQPRPTAVQLQSLRGRPLGCFCRLDQPCHADALLQIVNRPPS